MSMSKTILDNLFGSRARVKILKLLFRSYPSDFSIQDIMERTQESLETVQREIALLRRLGLVSRKFK